MDLAIIILATDPKDLACLQPAHQVSLAMLLHQRWGLLGCHGGGWATGLQSAAGRAEGRSLSHTGWECCGGRAPHLQGSLGYNSPAGLATEGELLPPAHRAHSCKAVGSVFT